MTGETAPEVRQARAADREAVVAFTEDTWPERGGDYIPRVFDEWVETDGARQRTLVAEVDGEVAAICQGVLLTEHEAWAQGMRVAPDHRGRGVGVELIRALFDWAAGQGATVCRNMVFSWNVAGLGQSRAVGFEPAAEFRWAHPEPDPEADAGGEGTEGGADLAVVDDPSVAWAAWRGSDARRALSGIALDAGESWALSELTRERLVSTAAETRALAVRSGVGAVGAALRTRTYDRENGEGETETWAEYGAAAWRDATAARALFAAVARDAARLGADRTRVLVPETPRHVSDAAYVRAAPGDEPDFVLEADLTTRR